jgi:hypothetical protein
MRSKYNATKTAYDGITFDSKREMVRYIELKEKERCGQICGLERQVSFELLQSYKIDGKTVRSINYKADFCYTIVETGEKVVEDVKGYADKVFLLKKKMFEYKYGKLTIVK